MSNVLNIPVLMRINIGPNSGQTQANPSMKALDKDTLIPNPPGTPTIPTRNPCSSTPPIPRIAHHPVGW